MFLIRMESSALHALNPIKPDTVLLRARIVMPAIRKITMKQRHPVREISHPALAVCHQL